MIDIQNITFRYPGQSQPVFSDFSLRLSESHIYGLLGKNGTGKSTLLYLIAGLLRPASGSVCCNNVAAGSHPAGLLRPASGSVCCNNVAAGSHPAGLLRPASGSVCCNNVAAGRRSAEMLRNIFIVTEEFDLPAMTLQTYVRLIAPFYPRFSREVLQSCLDDFELPVSLQLSALSMGQKKKVYMSIALAARTPLLLMDEPTNGLDIPSKSQFRRIVARNMADDQTLIISTHQVHDVESLLDHLLILSDSTLLLNASVQDLTDRYAFTLRPAGPSNASAAVAGASFADTSLHSPAAQAAVAGASSADSAVLYAEPTLQGNAVITRRRAGDPETPLNLELLFNAVTKGLLK